MTTITPENHSIDPVNPYQAEDWHLKPNESLGQHFLLDQELLNSVGEEVLLGANVIEVGVGPGNLTQTLLDKAHFVYGFELDRRFEDVLEQQYADRDDVEIVYADVLKVDLEKDVIQRDPEAIWQIVSNLPFHISEPFIKQLSQLPVHNAVLLVGDNLAHTLNQTDPNSGAFSRLSLLAHTYFNVEHVADVDRQAFWPAPRTDATLIKLSPRDESEYTSRNLAIFKSLFDNEHTSQTVRKGISTASLVSRSNIEHYGGKKEAARGDRRAYRQSMREVLKFTMDSPDYLDTLSSFDVIEKAEMPNVSHRILDTPFNNLNSSELRILAKALGL